MGVEVRREGTVVSIYVTGTMQGRDSTAWADVVRAAFAASGRAIGVYVELAPDADIPISQLTSGCRAAIPLIPLIEAVAMVSPQGHLRSMLRCAISAISPRYPFEYFDEMVSARSWLDRRGHANAAA